MSDPAWCSSGDTSVTGITLNDNTAAPLTIGVGSSGISETAAGPVKVVNAGSINVAEPIPDANGTVTLSATAAITDTAPAGTITASALVTSSGTGTTPLDVVPAKAFSGSDTSATGITLKQHGRAVDDRRGRQRHQRDCGAAAPVKIVNAGSINVAEPIPTPTAR